MKFPKQCAHYFTIAATSHSSTTESVIAGGLSGFSTRLLLHPFDVVKIRLQLQCEPIRQLPTSKYKSLQQTLLCILKEESVGAFWKGHISAQLLSVVYGSVQFGVMNTLVRSTQRFVNDGSMNSSVRLFVCGGVAGCSATVAAQPFDLMRTRFIGKSAFYLTYCCVSRSFLIVM